MISENLRNIRTTVIIQKYNLGLRELRVRIIYLLVFGQRFTFNVNNFLEPISNTPKPDIRIFVYSFV